MLKYIIPLLILLQGEVWAMKIVSKDFTHEGMIPQIFSCEGEDKSPELSWSDVPTGAKSLVLICDDPDAPVGMWDHWVLFNLPATTKGLAQATKDFPEGTGFGKNSWGRNDYGGPCPPDRTHRYFFKLFALDSKLDLPNGATKKQVEDAMKGHILAQAELMGKYPKAQKK